MAQYTKPTLGLISILTLAACGPMGGEAPEYLAPSTKVVAQDVEAPEIFKTTATGAWDGLPSLGGVWVAHNEAPTNSRAIIRNPSNGTFVVGALYSDTAAVGGAKFQVSSDAASALGMVANTPTVLDVTALRPNQETPPAPTVPTPMNTDTSAAPAAVPEIETPRAPAGSSSAKVQVGLFGVEANAAAAAAKLRNAGLSAAVKATDLNGKTFWNVTASPANSSLSAAALLTKVKAQGFSDAYILQK